MASSCLGHENQRLVYLITYSRANTVKFPTRESFAEAILDGWRHCRVRVQQWVVCLEAHADAERSSVEVNNRYHYHMAVKLSKRARWLQVRNYIDQTHGIQVNFSENHSGYYSAYQYLTKEDKETVHSPNHPDLQDPPQTQRAIAGKRTKAIERRNGRSKKVRKVKRLSVYDVTKLMKAKQITTRLQLVCLAVEQEREGKTSLAEFIANRGNRVVDEGLSLAKEFSLAEAKQERSKKSRLQLLEEQRNTECCEGCHGDWLSAAIKLLERQGIVVSAFCEAIYSALAQGRGKYRNVYIHGPCNTGKTFILSPLKKVYNAFCNPATGSFAWVGAEDAEVILLNDFRWNPAIIAWADFLQALEGDIVHLPAPKNFCKQDVEFSKDTPFFATSDAPLILVKGSFIDLANTEMMNVRWRFFHFWKQIPPTEQQNLTPCGHCFAKLILEHK